MKGDFVILFIAVVLIPVFRKLVTDTCKLYVGWIFTARRGYGMRPSAFGAFAYKCFEYERLSATLTLCL
jgi:hypothetical protein